jgi:GTP-sensing pleiotropic transcriptional regulator CodY
MDIRQQFADKLRAGRRVGVSILHDVAAAGLIDSRKGVS